MKTTNEKKPVWYLALPVYLYNEDVNALAEAAGLRIIDANVTDDRTGAAPDELLPQVTLRDADPGEAPAEPEALQIESANDQANKIEADDVHVLDVPYESAEQQALLSQYPNTEDDAAPAGDKPEAKPAPTPRKKKGE